MLNKGEHNISKRKRALSNQVITHMSKSKPNESLTRKSLRTALTAPKFSTLPGKGWTVTIAKSSFLAGGLDQATTRTINQRLAISSCVFPYFFWDEGSWVRALERHDPRRWRRARILERRRLRSRRKVFLFCRAHSGTRGRQRCTRRPMLRLRRGGE